MEPHLRQKSQTLLKQLQLSQQLLNSEIDLHVSPREAVSRSVNLSGNEDSFVLKPAYARHKLLGATKQASDNPAVVKQASDNPAVVKQASDNPAVVKQASDNPAVVKARDTSRRDILKNKENIYGSNYNHAVINNGDKSYSKTSSVLNNVESDSRLRDTESDNQKKDRDVLDNKDDVISSSWQPATPNTQRRRNMIDRHIVVPTQLDAKELRDLNKERLLNFSYSQVCSDDGASDTSDGKDSQSCKNQRKILKSGRESQHEQKGSQSAGDLEHQLKISKSGEDSDHQTANVGTTVQAGESKKETADAAGKEEQAEVRVDVEHFKKQLEDDGNNRKLNNFIRNTTIKPKSLLNSTSYSLHNLSTSKRSASSVRFDMSRDTQESLPDQRLLGYDWIAALLDNDSALIDQSESFFNDLREFRKAYKDECSNRFYMEGPHTLVDFEPQPVVEALKEPKVEPYVVNERLFPEPVNNGLVDYEDGDSNRRSREPTADNPRFVRVSIPRSTLQSPQRWKPHRRGSFGSGDSCSLKDHCLLGWENRVPTVIPTARYVDLKTAAGTGKDYQKITLAEAERQASTHSYSQWPFERSAPRLDLLHHWQTHYSDAARSMTLPASNSGSNSTSRSTSGPDSVKRVTDKLLNSTYATMYEMERLKEERRLERMTKQQKK